MGGAGLLFACIMIWGAPCNAQEETKKSSFFSRIVDLVKKKEEPPPPPATPRPETKPAAPKNTASKPRTSPETAKPKAATSATAKKTTPKTTGKEPPKVAKGGVKKEPVSDAPKKDAPGDKPAGGKPDARVAEKPSSSPGKSETADAKTTPKTADGKDRSPANPDTRKGDTKSSAGSKPVAAAESGKGTKDDSSPAPDDKAGEFDKGDKPMDVTTSSKVDTVTSTPAAQLKEPTEPAAPPYPLPPAKNGGWQLVKIHGRDYVSAENIQQFYRFASLKVERTHVWLKSPNLILKAQIGSQDMLINNIKFILSYPVEDWNGRAMFSRLDLCKLIEPILRPNYITGAEPFDTVVVDAGHGGHDAGARGVYGYEKDFALQMARTVRSALQKRGFKVIMTRDSDTFISRTGRVAIANRTPNSIFVSLHFNSGGSAATGIETFALTPQGSSASLARGGGYNASGLTGNRQDSENIALATAVHGMVMYRCYTLVDRGIKRAQWTVLTGCNRPGILFEGGFITNSQECRLIASTTYRETLANAIGDAILNYRKALQPTLNSPVRR